MRHIFLAGLTIAAMCVSAQAMAKDLFSPDQKKQLMQNSLKVLWEKGVDTKGERLKPKDEKQRKAIPIPVKLADEVINNGIQSALANWCNVPWQDHYILYMQHVRQLAPETVQVAYAGVLHGMTQGTVENSMKGQACPEDVHQRMITVIQQDSDKLKQALSAPQPKNK